MALLLPEEMRAKFELALEIEATDESGRTVNKKEFVAVSEN